MNDDRNELLWLMAAFLLAGAFAHGILRGLMAL
jgi:hypothetical protein